LNVVQCRVLFVALVLIAASIVGEAVVFAAVLDLGAAKLAISEQDATTSLTFSDGARWPSGGPAFAILAGGQSHAAKSIAVDGDRWTVRFANGVVAEFRVG